MPAIEYTRPHLYPKQLEAIFCSERYSLVEASTKSGKTVGCMAWLLEQALMGTAGGNYWWVAPGYSQAEIAFRRIKAGLTRGSFVPSESPVPKITLINNNVIWFKSGDNPDSLYGEDVYAAVIDEASRTREESWFAIRSTLTATNGPVRIIGNVKGRKNWFYALARKAEEEMMHEPDASKRRMHYSKITVLDAIEAGITAAEELEDAKEILPEVIFRELYYAEPGDDTGNPFGLDHIRDCSRTTKASGPAVAWGIDIAKSQDYFVCIGLNENNEVCEFHRWRGVPWRDSIRKVWNLVGEDVPALIDSTGVGDPVLEELQFEHGNFQGYHFSSTSKQKLMEGLSISIQSHEITFPTGPISLELEMFEYAFTRTGIKYSAPEGQHDDCVCALALARELKSTVAPGVNVMKYYSNTIAKNRIDEAQVIPEVDNPRPWRNGLTTVANDDTLTNELTDLYNQTFGKTLNQGEIVCFNCKQPITGPTKTTDGEHVWHINCVGYRSAA